MKIFSALILITISLCAGLCCPEEKGFDNIFIENNDIIKINGNKNTFNVGDKIYISVTINPLQTSSNNKMINLLDLINFTNDSVPIYNSFSYKKETKYNTLSNIIINETDLEVLSGEISLNNEFIEIYSLNHNSNNFICEFGITLLETGVFYLSSSSFYVDGLSNTTISIASKIKNSDINNRYRFEVN